MAEKKREPFGRRVYNACRALRGEPWPQVFQFANPPLVVRKPLNIQTCTAAKTFSNDERSLLRPEDMNRIALVEIADALATFLMSGVTIHPEEIPGGIRYTGRLQVVMPEKEDNNAD